MIKRSFSTQESLARYWAMQAVELCDSIDGADFEEQKQALLESVKELEKARKNLSSLEGKLNNENFVSRAPANVVDDIRQKAQKARDLIAGLEQSEEAMKKI